ncbi:MAG: hypothetical protein H6Q73_103 [Firmicutes bacterium]|nr:hypothetical protein [Bacillota bacterium]
MSARSEKSGVTSDKTTRVVSLFMAITLLVAPGCATNTRPGHVHVDKNGDGYCDEDGQSMHSSSGSSGYYRSSYYGGSSSESSSGRSTGISTGSHGGIGGSSVSGGG